MSCWYVHFRKTTGGEPDILQGQIVGCHYRLNDWDADAFGHEDTTNYGNLTISEANHDSIISNLQSEGTPGKHVDDPTGTPTLADGDIDE